MNTRSLDHESSYHSISFQSIQNTLADRTFFIKEKYHQINSYISHTLKDLYTSLKMTFSLDHINFYEYKKILWPIISSGIAFIIGEYASTRLSRSYTHTDEYDFIFKFLLGIAIIGYSANRKITEKKPSSELELSFAYASEALSIAYLYTSSYRASQAIFSGLLSYNTALITSLSISTLATPGAISYLVQKHQEKQIKKLYQEGSQRKDTTLISSGLTPIANTYFQLNHFLLCEMSTFSRLFQLALISDNIQHANNLLQQFRNLPALLVDAGPKIIDKIITEQKKISADYQHNNSYHKVLKFIDNAPAFLNIKRYQLRNDDLVYCDNQFDTDSAPISGEVVSLQLDNMGLFTQNLNQEKFSINLKANNGEDVWIEKITPQDQNNKHPEVDLHAIHEGKQTAILTGTKLNLFGKKTFFIKIKPEKELINRNNFQKTPVIDQIIAERKKENTIYSMVASMATALILENGITSNLPAHTLQLLFNLFQMMIQFAENFLREMVNSKLLKDLNATLTHHPIEANDALRIVDLCNALCGYYQDRFPAGVAIISDKTGTLTTSKMDARGIWTNDMNPNVQDLLAHTDTFLLCPAQDKRLFLFEIFAGAFTNNKETLEPEEHAILRLLKQSLSNNVDLNITTLGNNHFRKTLCLHHTIKTIETFHLGLFHTLGGRLTLVDEHEKKYLLFCGIPRKEKLQNTPVFDVYSTMKARTGVLSRDWCIARTQINDKQFDILKNLFYFNDKIEIENYILLNRIHHTLTHYGTFIIDNPVKKGAEKFIARCKNINVPVFIATGDTASAAQNIAKVLYPDNAQHITMIHHPDDYLRRDSSIAQNDTIIFTNINNKILALFDQFMSHTHPPVIIFSEMSTEGKGILARHLKNKKFFVVANGDGTNDLSMMQQAHAVITHLTENGTYAPGIQPFSDLNDKQTQELFKSDKSFYELFDIDQSQSHFIKKFAPLANSQEKPSIALMLKSSKMSFELAKSLGATDVKDMWQQHWCSVAFDLIWLWISFNEINLSTDLPMDNQNLNVSHFPFQCMMAALAFAALQALANYMIAGESTNITSMVLMLTFLPLALKSIFSAFAEVRDDMYPETKTPKKSDIKDEDHLSPQKNLGIFGSCFKRKKNMPEKKETLHTILKPA